MATPAEVDLITRLRDAIVSVYTPAMRASNPAAVQAQADATAWLANPDVDIDGGEPVFGYTATLGGVLTHVMVDKRRRAWKFDAGTKRFVLL